MDKENALISIKNNSEAFGDEAFEFVCVGGYYEKNGTRYIMYEEKEEMGMADCSVMIKVCGNEVTVSRKGAISSKMVYKTGDVTQFIYHMPYGDMPIILNTKKIKNTLDDNGGRLNLFYTITMNGEEHEHSMIIDVKLNDNN